MSKAIKDYKNIFAKRLSELIKERELTHESVAQGVGVTRQGVGKWVSGDSVPDVLTVAKLAKFFNVSVDYLAGNSDVHTADMKLQAVCEYTGLNEESINFFHSQVLMDQLADLAEGDYDAKDAAKDFSNNISNITNWIINSGFFNTITMILVTLDNNNKNFFEEVEKSKLHQNNNAKHYRCLKKMYKFYMNCDLQRYKLMQLSEQMANHFHDPQKMNQQFEQPRTAQGLTFSHLVSILEKNKLLINKFKEVEDPDNGEHQTPKE